jgi:hypothetical protein
MDDNSFLAGIRSAGEKRNLSLESISFSFQQPNSRRWSTRFYGREVAPAYSMGNGTMIEDAVQYISPLFFLEIFIMKLFFDIKRSDLYTLISMQ